MMLVESLKVITSMFWKRLSIPYVNIKISQSRFSISRFRINNFEKSQYYSEEWLFRLLSLINENREINVFFDIGVNIGQTLLKVKSINRNINYFGFEPNPYCCTVLENIIEINQLKDCHIIPCGLSDKSDLLKLKLDKNDNFDSSASLVPDFRKTSISDRFQIVSVNKLDDVIDKLNCQKVDVIKIDIEGGELEAIKGMERTISDYHPIIILEVLPSYSEENIERVSRQLQLAEILAKLHYSIYQIVKQGESLQFIKTSSFPIHSNLDLCDYILLPFDINLNSLKLQVV